MKEEEEEEKEDLLPKLRFYQLFQENSGIALGMFPSISFPN
jgi:hypothetical protein